MGDLARSYREHFGGQASRGTRMIVRFNSSNEILSTTGDIGLSERGGIVERFLGDRYDPAAPKISAKDGRIYHIEFYRESPEEPLEIRADMGADLRDKILSIYLNQVRERIS